ncbi:MAG: HAD family hydrolase [Candidatus Obscuribacterales bacterium]
MRYLALACDYDGTLTSNNQPDPEAFGRLRQVRASGRKVILVTGRTLEQLNESCQELDAFDSIVLENGAVLYDPNTGNSRLLCDPVPAGFVTRLKKRGVAHVGAGKAIVSTWSPHESAVLGVIRKMGLDLQLSFNRNAVLVLPPGVNKASGLQAALEGLGISPHNVVGVGNGENDHIFLSYCKCSVAVANAVPLVKQDADWVLKRPESEGFCDLIDELVNNDLQKLRLEMHRDRLQIGSSEHGPVSIDAHNSRVLIAGPSRSGKSRLTCGRLERLGADRYQYCVVDPEADFDGFPGAVTLGSNSHAPDVDHVVLALKNPDNRVTVNLVGLAFAERPAYFVRLLNAVQDLRLSTGRPHWFVVEEAHHMLYPDWKHASQAMPRDFPGLLLVTVHPTELSTDVLKNIDTVIATGRDAHDVINDFTRAQKLKVPPIDRVDLDVDEVLLWLRSSPRQARKLRLLPTLHEHRRHVRKYAQGDVGYHRSFFFTGPDFRLNLQASNLRIFVRIADGVDDDTWLHHLHLGHYAKWFQEVIKDQELADLAESLAHSDVSAAESRNAINNFIHSRYTLPERPSLFGA